MEHAQIRILYLGANLRMRLSSHSSPGLRALGLKQGLEQAGMQIVPFMAGDQVDSASAWTIYSKQLKRFLPQSITGTLRDVYEIILDRRFYRVAEARLRDNKPDIILQEHMRYGQVGVSLGRRHNIPVFLDDIAPLWEEERYYDRSLKPIAHYIRKKVFSQASGLIAVSRDMKKQLQSEGVPNHKIIFVPNGVDCTLFNPDTNFMSVRQKYGLSDKLVVGYVGGFAQWHRLDLLLQVASSLIGTIPHIHFLLVGDDSDQRVESMARERGLTGSFTFPGGISNSEVPSYLNAMDITILPSVLPYMCPMKIYEYMAMGKPIIAPNNNSIVEEVVIPYQHGLLFEAENADAMKNAIILLAADPTLREKMGKEARKSALDKYTWYHQASNLIKTFQSVSTIQNS